MEEVVLDVEQGETYVPRALYYFANKYSNDPPSDIGAVLPDTEINGYYVGRTYDKFGPIEYFFKSEDDKRIKVMYRHKSGQSSNWNYLTSLPHEDIPHESINYDDNEAETVCDNCAN